MCRAGERTVNAAVGFVRGACVPPVKKLRQHAARIRAQLRKKNTRTEAKIPGPILKNFIRILLCISE